MGRSRERYGRSHPGISVIGEIIARRGLVYSFIRMETSMKECGPWTKSMGKELIGEMKILSLEESILEIGLKIKSMEEVRSSSRTLTDTTDIG